MSENKNASQNASTVEISYPELKELFTDILAKLSEEDLRDFHEEVGAMLEADKVTMSRDEIVSLAKGDISLVEEQLSKTGVSVEFVVNAEKRTVVALTKFRWMKGTYVRSRGISKAHPDDCFNEYIGKAIALRRALGNPPMYEYLNAPQPAGIEVGDLIRVYYEEYCPGDPEFFEREVSEVKTNGYEPLDEYVLVGGGSTSFCSMDGDKVIDDSNRY